MAARLGPIQVPASRLGEQAEAVLDVGGRDGLQPRDVRVVGLLEIAEARLVDDHQAPLVVAADLGDTTAGLRVGQPSLAAVEDELHVLGMLPGLRHGVAGRVAARQGDRLSGQAAAERGPPRTPAVDEQLAGLELADVRTPRALDVLSRAPARDAATAADDDALASRRPVAVRLVDHAVAVLPRVAGRSRQAQRLAQPIGAAAQVDDDVRGHPRRPSPNGALRALQRRERAALRARPGVPAVGRDEQLHRRDRLCRRGLCRGGGDQRCQRDEGQQRSLDCGHAASIGAQRAQRIGPENALPSHFRRVRSLPKTRPHPPSPGTTTRPAEGDLGAGSGLFPMCRGTANGSLDACETTHRLALSARCRRRVPGRPGGDGGMVADPHLDGG